MGNNLWKELRATAGYQVERKLHRLNTYGFINVAHGVAGVPLCAGR